MKYISFIDILGTKNSSENENFDAYIALIADFQNTLISQAKILGSNGRVHFFSDCAYIEAADLITLIQYLVRLRDELLQYNIFIRGSITKGVLGAISGSETIKEFNDLYQNELLSKKFNQMQGIRRKNSNVFGTIFLSQDLSKAYFYENSIKAASIYIDDVLIKESKTYAVKSGFIKSMDKLTYVGFYDIGYNESYITEEFLNHILYQYTVSNGYDESYGRYYLSILITCISSTNFSSIEYNSHDNEFINAPFIFYAIFNLRKEFTTLYNHARGLEYLYLKLLDKIYFDLKKTNLTTKYLLKNIFVGNKKHLSKYQNKLSAISKDILSPPSKNLLMKDYHELIREKLL